MTLFGDSVHPGDHLDICLLASFRGKADFCMLKQGVHQLILVNIQFLPPELLRDGGASGLSP